MERWSEDVDPRINFGLCLGRDQGILQPKLPVVVVTGSRPGEGNTSTIRIITIPDNTPVRVMAIPEHPGDSMD